MVTDTKKDSESLVKKCHQEKKRLSKEQIDIHMEDGWVIASLYEYPPGCRWWDRFSLSELPNDLISRGDLIRFGINLIN